MVAQALSGCKPGDQVTIHATIASDGPDGLTLTATDVGYDDESAPNDGSASDPSAAQESTEPGPPAFAPAPSDPIGYAIANRKK